MKLIKYLIILLLFSSCVSLNQFNDLKDKYNNSEKERKELAEKNISLTESNTELNSKNSQNDTLIDKIKKANGILNRDNRSLKNQLERCNRINETVMNQQERANKGNTVETRQLLKELQKNLNDLQKKEGNLLALEGKLKNKERNLNELSNVVKEKEKNLNDLNNVVKDKNERLKKLEQILSTKDTVVNDLRAKVVDALTGFKDMGLSINIRNGKVYVSLDEKLLFKSGRYQVDPNGISALNKLSEVLANNPDINVMIEGHTDDIPYNGKTEIVDNWDLSVKRATSIVRVITQNSKIDPSRIIAAGRSQYVPIDNSGTNYGRQKNRRIEIILTPKLDELFKILNSN